MNSCYVTDFGQSDLFLIVTERREAREGERQKWRWLDERNSLLSTW